MSRDHHNRTSARLFWQCSENWFRLVICFHNFRLYTTRWWPDRLFIIHVPLDDRCIALVGNIPDTDVLSLLVFTRSVR